MVYMSEHILGKCRCPFCGVDVPNGYTVSDQNALIEALYNHIRMCYAADERREGYLDALQAELDSRPDEA